jgi:hypothetical protein
MTHKNSVKAAVGRDEYHYFIPSWRNLFNQKMQLPDLFRANKRAMRAEGTLLFSLDLNLFQQLF